MTTLILKPVILGFIFMEDAYDAAALRVYVLKGEGRTLVELRDEVFELAQLVVELNVSPGIVNVGAFNYLDDFDLLLIHEIDLLDYLGNLETLVFELLLLTSYDFVEPLDLLHEDLEVAF